MKLLRNSRFLPRCVTPDGHETLREGEKKEKDNKQSLKMEADQKWGAAAKAAEERIRGAPLRRHCRDLCGAAFCVAASLLFLGVSGAVFVWISELQSRIVHLEQQQDAQISALMRSAEQVEPALLGRLDHVLEEVSSVRLILVVSLLC